MWVITTYFNPMGYKTRYDNFVIFYSHIKKQAKGQLLVVELADSKENLVLHKLVPENNLIQLVHQGPQLWQKEALLNIAVSHLPSSCYSVCWIDADVVFLDDTWLDKVEIELSKQTVDIVQPFTYILNVPKNAQTFEDVMSYPTGHDNGLKSYGYIAGWLSTQKASDGHPGFVWAAKRSVLDRVKLYTDSILGGADWILARATAHCGVVKPLDIFSQNHRISLQYWAWKLASSIQGYGFVYNVGYHLYHGKIDNRNYEKRLKLLVNLDYNPYEDIAINNQGLIILTSKGLELEQHLVEYFKSRNEDDSNTSESTGSS